MRKADGDTLSLKQAVRLGEILNAPEPSDVPCFFAVWEGYSVGVTEGEEWVHFDRFGAPSFDLPQRRYVLFRGPYSDLERFVWDGYFQAPDIWWPDDHHWCVGSDTDLAHVYVAASQEAVDGVLSDPVLSGEPSRPDYRIDLDPGAGS